MLELKNIYKTYKNRGEERVALRNLSVKFPSKGLVSVIGKSGSGKSTLVNIIAGLDSLDSGKVFYNGEDIFELKKVSVYRNFYVGMIFQDFHLIEDLTVYENIKLALDLQNQDNYNERIEKVLEKLEITHLKSSYVNELSGGEKQRVSTARAIVKGAKILLADEPTGNLDIENAKKTYTLLRELSKEILVILITHDEESASRFSDYVFKLRDGELLEQDRVVDEEKLVFDEKLDLSKKEGKTIALSNKLALKRKGRLIFTVVLSILAISLFAFAINLKMLNPETMYYNTLVGETYDDFYVKIDAKEEYLALTSVIDDLSTIEQSTYYRNNYYILDFFNLNGSIGIVDNNLSRFYVDTFNYISVNENNDELLSIGEVGITDYMASCILLYSDLVFSDINDLVGYDVVINGYDFKIGYIIDTDYEEYLELVDDTFNYFDDDELDFKVKHQYSTVYMIKSDYESIRINPESYYISSKDILVEVLNADNFSPGWLDQDFPDSENEIALSYGYIITNNLVTDDSYANVIGSSINIVYSYGDNQTYSKEYTIVGTYDSYLNSIVLQDEEYFNMANNYSYDSQPSSEYIHFKIGDGSDSEKIMKYIYDSDFFVQNIAWEGYQFSKGFCNDIAVIALIVGIILFVLAAGMIGHFITVFITDNNEITGILLALGATKQKIYKIYLWRSFIQVIIVILAVIPILFLTSIIMNNFIMRFDTGIKIFYVNYLSVVLVFLLCIVLYFGCTVVPLRRFFKKDINSLIYDRV